MKRIKLFLQFMRLSRSFTGHGYFKMILKEQALKRSRVYIHSMLEWERQTKETSTLTAYANLNRVMEMWI